MEEHEFDAAFGGAAATRRRPGQGGCSRSATSSASGTRRTSAPSSGTSTAAATAGAAHPGLPLSNWTELDIWRYIAEGQIEIPAIYAPTAGVFRRDGMLLAVGPYVTLADDEDALRAVVRSRTVGGASLHQRGQVVRRHHRPGDRRGGRHPASPARRHPPTTRLGWQRPWKPPRDEAGRLFLMGCSPLAAGSVDDGKST